MPDKVSGHRSSSAAGRSEPDAGLRAALATCRQALHYRTACHAGVLVFGGCVGKDIRAQRSCCAKYLPHLLRKATNRETIEPLFAIGFGGLVDGITLVGEAVKEGRES